MCAAPSGITFGLSIDVKHLNGADSDADANGGEFRANPKHLDGAANLSELTYLELPNVLHNLKCRYDRNEIYTSMNEILVAVNPYQAFQRQYSADRIREFQESPRKRREIPHIYATAARALHDLFVKRRSQSIIVCGESGSGKTESSKSVQRYITATSKQASELASQNILIEKQILAVNPILEGFGNATTTMNDNSSRFAKFTKIVFERFSAFEGRSRNVAKQLREAANIPIVGSVIQTYLLEKSRVIFQDNGEMNFHIFYQLFQLPTALKERFGLVDAKGAGGAKRRKFAYLNHGVPADAHVAPKYSATALEEVQKAFAVLGVDAERQAEILGVVASILHLGNVDFATSSANQLEIAESSREHLEKAAELLHLEVAALEERLLGRWIRAGGGDPILKRYLEQDEAIENRDSVSKTIYQGVFTHVVDVINAHLLPVDPNESEFDEDDEYQMEDSSPFIGILDVFGFECFEHNSLEQYCINFANECLQQFFNDCVIASEQDEYVREAVEWEPIEVPDNEERIQMIKTGFKELHSTCKMPKGEPEYFVQNFVRRYPNSQYVMKLGPQSMTNMRSQSRTSSPRSGSSIAHSRASKMRSHTPLPSHSRARSRSTVIRPKATDTLRMSGGGGGGRNSMRRKVPGTPNAKGGRPNDSFGTENSGFQVSHYAGNVQYVAKDFLKKNRDYPHIDTVPLLCNSKSAVVSALVAEQQQDHGDEAGGGGRRMQGSNKSSVGAVFMKQMDLLMDHLGQTDPFFVRCLTPNPHKVAKLFDAHYVSKQLSCGGLIEALSVQKKGYPTRVEYAKIHEFYSHVPSLQFMNTFTKPDFCEAILLGFEVPVDGYKLGTSKVFFKPHAAHMLQQILASKDGPPAAVIERVRVWRRRKLVRKWRVVTRSSIILVRSLKGLRATNMWYHAAGIVCVIARAVMPTLRRVRRRIRARKLKEAAAIVERWRHFKLIRDRFLRHMRQKRAMQRAVDTVARWRRFKVDRDRFLAHMRAKAAEAERQRQVLEEAERIRRAADAEAAAKRDAEQRERAAREAAEAEMRRKIEAEGAEQRRKMEEEADRLRKETERLRKEADEAAARLRREQEAAAAAEAEEAERRRRDKAEAEATEEVASPPSSSSTGRRRRSSNLSALVSSSDEADDAEAEAEGDTSLSLALRMGHKMPYRHPRRYPRPGLRHGNVETTPMPMSRRRKATRGASRANDADEHVGDADASLPSRNGGRSAAGRYDGVLADLRDEFDNASNSGASDGSGTVASSDSSSSGESEEPGSGDGSGGSTGVSLAHMQAMTERMDRQEKLLLDTISALNRVTAVQQQQATTGGASDLSAAQRDVVVQQMRAEMRAEVETMDSRLRHLESHSQMYIPTDTSPVSLLWRIPTFVVTKALEFPFDVVRSIVNGVRHPAPPPEQPTPSSPPAAGHGHSNYTPFQQPPHAGGAYQQHHVIYPNNSPYVSSHYAHSHANGAGAPYLLSPHPAGAAAGAAPRQQQQPPYQQRQPFANGQQQQQPPQKVFADQVPPPEYEHTNGAAVHPYGAHQHQPVGSDAHHQPGGSGVYPAAAGYGGGTGPRVAGRPADGLSNGDASSFASSSGSSNLSLERQPLLSSVVSFEVVDKPDFSRHCTA